MLKSGPEKDVSFICELEHLHVAVALLLPLPQRKAEEKMIEWVRL
jgi:hypothetical protein